MRVEWRQLDKTPLPRLPLRDQAPSLVGDPRVSAAYQKGVAEHCRNARVVFDKYHVIAHVCQAMGHVRKSESHWGTDRARVALQKTLWLWRKNPPQLRATERLHLENLRSIGLWTAKAYQMRLALQENRIKPKRARPCSQRIKKESLDLTQTNFKMPGQ